ncbi:hypothetical protein GCM10010297_38850 [Streptomyces malachitofuscus]|nr:hypothetical protein GCM10010297_38850 [Streptomyces malachitofuscus]
MTSPKGPSGPLSVLRRGAGRSGPTEDGGAGPGQSAKLEPKYGVPVLEMPEVLGEMKREPLVVIFVPLDGM